MNKIKITHKDGDSQGINLICVEGNEYCYFDNPESQFYIVNFKEVKEKLLKLCE